jgi:hypothetical protein
MKHSGRSFPVRRCALITLVVAGLVAVGSAYGQAVTGSGTAGRLTKWTSTSTLGDSAVVETAGKLGVGSTHPAFNVEIAGTTPLLLGLLYNHPPSSGGGAGLQALITAQPTAAKQRLGFATFGVRSGASSYNSAAIAAFSSQPWVLGSAQGSYLTFETTAIDTPTRMERMRVTASGNVGIGIPNPSSKLSVAGVVQSTTGGFKFPDGTVQPTAIAPQRVQALEAAVASLQTQTQALLAAVASLQTENQSLKQQVTALQGEVQAINGSEVMALAPYLDVTQDPRGPLVRLTAVNLQIVNGMNSTDTVNGLGNLIVGYDETAPEGSAPGCADWTIPPGPTDTCVALKTGSHNFVVGSYNTYTQYGGLLGGTRNTLRGPFASVSGGLYNEAGDYSSVSGGKANRALGDASSVSGGYVNRASGPFATVSGGTSNLAGGDRSSVSGGAVNNAAGDFSSVCGGSSNLAYAERSSVSGGQYNIAGRVDSDHGKWASVCGGLRNQAKGDYSSISGGEYNTAEGMFSSVSGGKQRTAPADDNWVGGSLLEPF